MAVRLRHLSEFQEGCGEEIHPLLHGSSFSLEHIVSRGQASEPGFWYDQPKDEWVILVRGTATLEFADQAPLTMQAGDHLLIPAHCRHRVASTSADAHWIALHFEQRTT